MIELSIVVPCFNEADGLPRTVECLVGVLEDLQRAGRITSSSRVYFVDDGSRDETWALIQAFAAKDARVRGIKLSRNRGHQNALLAGLQNAPGDAVITMDADLQHDPNAIPLMLDAFESGNDVVYGVREARTNEGLLKRTTGRMYYRFLQTMGVEIVPEHADYRLLSRRAIEALNGYREVELFLRGLIPQLGFRSAKVTYKQLDRIAGESKYSIRKMLALGIQGITSFTAAPLRFITVLGFVVSIASLGFSVYALWVRLFTESALPGWASTVVPMYFLGGVQLLALGIMGEYLAKIYMETKRRPLYVIEEHAGFSPESPSNSSKHEAPSALALPTKRLHADA